MEKFEIFKLKEAGLSNEQVLRVLDYCRKDQVLPSLEEIARIARCRSILHFVDKYRQLDEDHLHKEFERFPSLSIFDPEYPEELLQIYNPPVLLFLPRRLATVNQTEDCSCWSSGDHARRGSFCREDN